MATFSISSVFAQGLQRSMATIQPFWELGPSLLQGWGLEHHRPDMIQSKYTSGTTLVLLGQSALNRVPTMFPVIPSMGILPQVIAILIRSSLSDVLGTRVGGIMFIVLKVSAPVDGLMAAVAIICVFYSRRTRVFMPRKPTTIASKLVYLCNSENMLADMRNSPPRQAPPPGSSAAKKC
ncbi:hypothetical protein B0H66DRAFT_538720 [Apodospora peruviana]|uniref:Uncharacterized protein n=1 Tax=Apodospora peruviana TaxID=516989 RepID=A0AAE0HTJ6_9PEZI|nr:hypothetical protein B0H66DRAFT_538720 [Apodospora peruviana]